MPDMVVIGAGPAGMAAALTAATAGAEVVVIDESPAPGGQIFRRPAADRDADYSRLPSYASSLGAFRNGDPVSGVTFRPQSMVWAIDDANAVYVAGPAGTEVLHANDVVIASGAYEWSPPVPGWTLPGVLTAGGAQALLKAHRVVPGRRVLLAGTGPLIVQVAVQLAEAGVHVAALLDVMPRHERWLANVHVLAHPAVAKEGMALLWHLRRRGIPVLPGWMVSEIRGDDTVTGVVAAPLDRRGRLCREAQRHWEVDTVCLSYGLVPSVELAALRGCELDYDAGRGGWVPRRDHRMQTTVAGVYAVGDGAGIRGARAAIAEGRIAGAAVAHGRGWMSASDAAAVRANARRILDRLQPVQRYLARVFRPRIELVDLIADTAVVCRCEEVTVGRVVSEIRNGARNLHEVKTSCRAGMGPCQGRLCMPTISRMLVRATAMTLAEIGYPRPRPPVKPLGLDQLTPVSRNP